ncbi:MAG TPA: hypothetical protein VF903_08470, partial [Nitrospirota bacterium]
LVLHEHGRSSGRPSVERLHISISASPCQTLRSAGRKWIHLLMYYFIGINYLLITETFTDVKKNLYLGGVF